MVTRLDEFVDQAAGHIRSTKLKTIATEGFAPKDMVGLSVEFCTLWPGIKVGLNTLEGFLPVWSKWLVSILIAIGDKACPPSATQQ